LRQKAAAALLTPIPTPAHRKPRTRRKVRDGWEQAPVLVYVWILLGSVAVVLVACFGVIVGWMLVLHRIAQSGIHIWDELEPDHTEPPPFG
jgi:hypothetical protein